MMRVNEIRLTASVTFVERGAFLRAAYCLIALGTGVAAGGAFWAAGMGEPFNFDGRGELIPRIIVATFFLSALCELFLAPILVGGWSYDTAAWSGAVSGWFLVAAGLACAAGIRRPLPLPAFMSEAEQLKDQSV
jgi:hypothetical protein